MAAKWLPDEVKAIAEVRKRLHKELTSCPQFPEGETSNCMLTNSFTNLDIVVGDRRILRFLRGKHMNIDEAVPLIRDFLQWRKENNVDAIRQEIVYGGKNTPFKFPKGKKILSLAPQIVITPKSVDKLGRPLAFELFNFNPKEVFKAITLEEYLLFLTYSLEYRVLVMEQMAHEYEQKYLREHPDPATQKPGWGVVLLDFTIRDLKGVGMAHLSSDGRALVGAALKLGYNNYSEYLGKNVMVNVPWVFNSMWYFVKGLLDPSTLAKITMCGADFMEALQKEMSIEYIPVALGGKFDLFNEPFDFDVSPSSTLYYEGCEADSEKYLDKRREFEAQDKEEYCYYWGGVTPPDSIYATNANDSTRTNPSESNKKAQTQVNPVAQKEKVEVVTPPVVSESEPRHSPRQQESHNRIITNSPPPSPRVDNPPATTVSSEKSTSDNSLDRQGIVGFFKFCYQQHLTLSIFAVLLLVFIACFHPEPLKSLLFPFIVCVALALFSS